jgi:hypothetical protein
MMTNNTTINPGSNPTINPATQVNAMSPANPIPGWLEQIALDDLAESIETWTTQMSGFHGEARGLYGTTGD